MKIKGFFILLLILLVIYIIVKADTIVATLFFLSPKYQSEIKTESLILKTSDVIKLLNDDFEANRSDNYEFEQGKMNLVVRLKNAGRKAAWGTLMCQVEEYKDVQINVPHLTPNMDEYVTFVIPLTGIYPLIKSDKPLIVNTKWKYLYSK